MSIYNNRVVTENVNQINKRNNFDIMKKYKMIIIGEIHSREMINYYDSLLSKIRPEYFIAEMAYEDVCMTKEELKDRIDNASDGTLASPCDYWLNFWLYELAYKHNVKLIGCDINVKVPKSHWGKLSEGINIENTFKIREKHMLDIIKQYDSKKCIVQLGDAHLRSIAWTKELQEWSENKKYSQKEEKENCLSYNSCIWEYYKNNRDVLIVRDSEDYQKELLWTKNNAI